MDTKKWALSLFSKSPLKQRKFEQILKYAGVGFEGNCLDLGSDNGVISFLLRDFLFGVILKLQRKMEVGLHVEMDGMAGKIVKAGYFSFDLKTKNGNIDTIPYHTIRSKVISKSGENINLEKYKISFRLHSDQNEKELGLKLKNLLINSPWVAPSQPQYIGDAYVVDGQKYIDVFVYTISEDYISSIKNYVIGHIDGLSV